MSNEERYRQALMAVIEQLSHAGGLSGGEAAILAICEEALGPDNLPAGHAARFG